jgi:hypothetical protein
VRQNFALGEFAHRAPQLLLLVRQPKFHGPSPIRKRYTGLR